MLKNGLIWSKRYNKEIKSFIGGRYYTVTDSDRKRILVHRLIWECANGCDIPDGYDVHHIDEDKGNNSIYNLELIEHKEHVRLHQIGKKLSEEHIKHIMDSRKGYTHTEETRRKISESNKGKKLSEEAINKIKATRKRKKVKQLDLNTKELIKVYPSVIDAAISVCKNSKSSKTVASNISEVCNGRRKCAYGYIWEFITD